MQQIKDATGGGDKIEFVNDNHEISHFVKDFYGIFFLPHFSDYRSDARYNWLLGSYR